MRPILSLILMMALMTACQEGSLPTASGPESCPFSVEHAFSILLPCDWETQLFDEVGDGYGGVFSNGAQRVVYLHSDLAFNSLEEIRIPDEAFDLEIRFNREGRLFYYNVNYDEVPYMMAYIESFNGKEKTRFIVKNVRNMSDVRAVIDTHTFLE